MGNDSIANRPLILMTALAGLALIPFVLMMVTSFVKMAVVLSIARQAIGTQQIPPNTVITGLAIILTVYTMSPVMERMYVDASAVAAQAGGENLLQSKNFSVLKEAAIAGSEPMRQFLKRHASLKDRKMFYTLAKRMRPKGKRAGITPDDYMILIPAFVVSELTEAFQIGFIIFLPFLVIDMVVSNILMALGMQMLSPTTISLPFKLLLFVLVDGWHLLTQGLVLGYT
ncbi:MAG: type III secretion system export apparatus subunit SctR [Myxococcota bacterium]|nr:type III secretion system export apparatus subunit SctR [Myxococcota bacterium]